MLIFRHVLDPGVGLMMATLYMGVIAAAGVLLVIVVLEATVLFLLKWGSLLKSLAASTAMNILSLAAGAAALTLVASLTRGFDMLDFLDGLFGAVALWMSAWVVSVLSEAVLLQAVRGRGNPRRLSWNASLAANAASYGLLLLITLFLSL